MYSLVWKLEDGHLRQLTEDVNRLANEVNRLREEMSQIWKASRDKKVKSISDNVAICFNMCPSDVAIACF